MISNTLLWVNKGSWRGPMVLFGAGIMGESKTTAWIWEVGEVCDKKSNHNNGKKRKSLQNKWSTKIYSIYLLNIFAESYLGSKTSKFQDKA